VNKRVLESLIKCGAFDSFGYNRRQLALAYEQFVEAAQRSQKKKDSGQLGMFDLLESGEKDNSNWPPIPDVGDWDEAEKLAFEKELLGFFITGHPLWQYRDRIKNLVTADSTSISRKGDRETVTVAGTVGSLKEITTKKTKERMASLALEDLTGSISIIIPPKVYRRDYEVVQRPTPLVIIGTVTADDDATKVMANEIVAIEEFLRRNGRGAEVHLYLEPAQATDDKLFFIKEVTSKYRGDSPTYLHIGTGDLEAVIDLGRQYTVSCTEALRSEIASVFGEAAVHWK